QRPLDAAVVTLESGDLLADAFIEDRLPGHQLEAKSVLDHCKASADEAGNAGEAATDVLAGICWHVGQAALCSHLVANALDFPSLQGRSGADGDVNVAIPSGCEPHLHKSLSATTEGVIDLSAEPAVGDCHTLGRYQLPVEPGRAVAADLLLEIEGGKDPNPEPIAALAEVIHLSAFNDVLGDLPMIGIDPFDMISPAQCLEAADMGVHVSLGVLAL